MSDPIRSDMDALPISQASERTTAETMQLRNRERLRQPETYGSSLEAAQVQRIEQAKRQRSGKKRSVTLRITQINRVLTERGSRTKVKYLRDNLQEAYNEILEVNEGLMQLFDPKDEVYGNDYVEELVFKLTSVAQKWNLTSSKEKMILHLHHHRRAQICRAMPVLLTPQKLVHMDSRKLLIFLPR